MLVLIYKQARRMKQYLHYTVEELALEQDFIDWVKTGKGKEQWMAFLETYPGKAHTIHEAKRLVEVVEPLPVLLESPMIEEEISRLMNTLELNETTQQPAKGKVKRILMVAAGIAAAVLAWIGVVAPGAGEIPSQDYGALVSSKKLVEQVNSSDHAIDILLPDGSAVKLSAGSRFSYAADFNDSTNRDVYLSGEAYFEVARDPRKPFRVFTNDLVTKVLGTSFTVRSFEAEKEINVTVRTGKVNVFRQRHQGLLLTANQQAIYSKQEKGLVRKLSEKPVIISPQITNQQMVFEDAPVVQVLELLKNAYGIGITYDKELMASCTITADLTDESIYRKLDLICRAIDAAYEIIDSEVYIQPKGCK